jgi:hypothetical protein
MFKYTVAHRKQKRCLYKSASKDVKNGQKIQKSSKNLAIFTALRWRCPMFRNLAFGENTLALRLENVLLRKPLSDLRAGYANRISCARGAQEIPIR